MKKILFIIIGILILFVGWQIYLIVKYEGNLIVNIANESNIDSVSIELYIDGQKQFSDIYTNESFHGYQERVFDIGRENHIITLKTKDNLVVKEIAVNTWLVTWVIVEFQKEDFPKNGYEFFVRKKFKPFFIQ